jgi:hypothetical protein
MENISQHSALDTILKYLIDNKSDRPIHSSTIWKDVFPDQEEEVIYFLLQHIMGTADKIVVTHARSEDIHNFDVFFEANAITERFLYDQGGFVRQAEKAHLAQIEQNRIDALNLKKLEAEVDIIEFQKGLGKKLTIWGFVIAVLSVLASVLTTFVSSQTPQDFSPRIDTLTHRIDALTDSVQSINLRLRTIELLKDQDTLKHN